MDTKDFLPRILNKLKYMQPIDIIALIKTVVKDCYIAKISSDMLAIILILQDGGRFLIKLRKV